LKHFSNGNKETKHCLQTLLKESKQLLFIRKKLTISSST
jgi:hypothetical protein